MKQRDRLPNGHFAPGNKASKGHGRPSKALEASYYEQLSKAVPPETIYEIAVKVKDYLLASPKNLDPRLIKLLLDKLVPNMPKTLRIEDDTYDHLADIISELDKREIDPNVFFRGIKNQLGSDDGSETIH